MLTYNTQQDRLVLPEYGRTIQQMVDRCLEIDDREERTRAAYAIIAAMGTLFPEMRQTEASQRKLWDHLSIMAGFALDIDWPVEPLRYNALEIKPLKVPYPGSAISRRQYGRSVEKLVGRVVAMEAGPERDELVNELVNHMKKLALAANPDGDVDAKVMRDLADYTNGEIVLDPATYRLNDYNIVAPVAAKKKRRKR